MDSTLIVRWENENDSDKDLENKNNDGTFYRRGWGWGGVFITKIEEIDLIIIVWSGPVERIKNKNQGKIYSSCVSYFYFIFGTQNTIMMNTVNIL